jgi:hypothetical protein
MAVDPVIHVTVWNALTRVNDVKNISERSGGLCIRKLSRRDF